MTAVGRFRREPDAVLARGLSQEDAVGGKCSKFERYARIQEYHGACNFDIGESYLRASWTTGSGRCRALALAHFEQAAHERRAEREKEKKDERKK